MYEPARRGARHHIAHLDQGMVEYEVDEDDDVVRTKEYEDEGDEDRRVSKAKRITLIIRSQPCRPRERHRSWREVQKVEGPEHLKEGGWAGGQEEYYRCGRLSDNFFH